MLKVRYVLMISLAPLFFMPAYVAAQGMAARPTIAEQTTPKNPDGKLSPKTCAKLLTKAKNSGKSMNIIIRRKMQLASRGCIF